MNKNSEAAQEQAEMNDMNSEAVMEQFAKIAFISIAALLILVLSLFLGYRYSRTFPSGLIFPGGVTYLGQSPTPVK